MEENKLRRGRPSKEKDKLSSSINLKLTQEDFNSVKEKAKKLGMKATQYAREMTLKGGIKSRFTLEELDFMRKLSDIANNLNQIARQANKSGFAQTAMEVMFTVPKSKSCFMIAKNIKGKSFKGCVSYVMNDSCELLEAEGVLAETIKDMIRSFAMQRSGRKEIKQPVGHIPISFAPEDSHRLTCNFMLQLAKEYMEEMGIINTQYIIVRHHNTDNDHLHIVYNRINNDLKLISVNNDYKRNIKVCKKLKDKYNLTYGKGKDRVKREKLNDPDKVKYKIYDAIKAVLSHCTSPNDLKILLKQSNIETEFKLKRTTNEIEGISFSIGKISFKGSQVDRKCSFGNLKKEFLKNIEAKEKKVPEPPQQPKMPVIGGVKLTPDQWQTLKDGAYIYLENMTNSKGRAYSAYVFTDDQQKKAFVTKQKPDSFVQYGKYEMRLMDKMRIEAGFVTKAKVKWYGIGNYAYPHLWKENEADANYKESWGDPRKPKKEEVKKESNKLNINKNKGLKM